MTKGNRLAALGVAWLLLATAQEASATLILIEPDNYAAGADMTNPVAGVTLQTLRNEGTGFLHFAPVTVGYSAACDSANPYTCQAVTGSHFLSGPGGMSEAFSFVTVTSCFTDEATRTGTTRCGNDETARSALNFLVISFEHPTDFVQIAGAWPFDHIVSRAFDANFATVGDSVDQTDMSHCLGQVEPETAYCTNTATLSTSTANISYVLAASWAGVGWIDTILFNDTSSHGVPEPGSLALFGIGLAGAGLMRRRRRAS